MKLHREKHFNTNLTMRATLLKNIFSNSVLLGFEVGDSITVTESHICLIDWFKPIDVLNIL